MPDDTELLRHYIDERSEAAISELVHRHLALVYSTALRRVGHDAQSPASRRRRPPLDSPRSALTLWCCSS